MVDTFFKIKALHSIAAFSNHNKRMMFINKAIETVGMINYVYKKARARITHSKRA
jgi:hypothetical protein